MDCEAGPVRAIGGLQVLLMRWAHALSIDVDITLGSIARDGDEAGRYRVPGEAYSRLLFRHLDEMRERAHDYDALSLHQWFDWMSLPERTLLMLHSSIEECYREEAALGFDSIEWMHVLTGLQRPHTVATCAKWATKTVEHHTGRSAITLHPGIPDDYLKAVAVPARDRRRVIACSGRMTSRKGVDVLLDLVEDNCLGDLVLEVSSLSPEPALLQRAEHLQRSGASIRVIAPFAGSSAHAEYLRNVAVVAAPSVLEGFGMIAVEAQAVGVPVVGLAAGGLTEAVLPGGGALIAPGDRSSLAAALLAYSHADVTHDIRVLLTQEFSIKASSSRKLAALSAIIN